MIIINRQPFDGSSITELYPEQSVERQLLVSMSESGEHHHYDSLDQLKFELRLRKETVSAAEELYRSKFSFATFYKSKCNTEYWTRTDNGGFMLKEGVKPSDAIRDIFENGSKYATECATAMQIVYYRALLNTFEESLFNKLFPRIYLMNWHSINPLLREIGLPKKRESMLIGDRGYFDNPDVDPKTPEWQGENVILLPGGLYYGHGIGIDTAEKIIHALNANRRKDAVQSAFLLDSTARPDYKKLASLFYEYSALPAA
jgi:protein-glutamine gamma-glutamyltransferase